MIYLDFEKNIKKLDAKIKSLEPDAGKPHAKAKLEKLQAKYDEELEKAYSDLAPWDRVQVARHPERPHALNYIHGMADGFIELAGDRMFADDRAIVGGIGYINKIPAMIIGEEKGDDTEARIKHNFGMPKPEGYRKAVRLMELADKFSLPVVMLVDTTGAYPGADAEARGQAQAIASSIQKCIDLNVPSVSVIIGEGGSGGAIALAIANTVFMLENSVYSVISPEGCASILWRSQDYKEEATKALKMTADDLLALKIIDNIIAEPIGGAHRHKDTVIANVKAAVSDELASLMKLSPKQLREKRSEKLEKMTRK
ncbi:MAG: acetyl-CoA carboxylase carboxyltransferase subunit alpha [Rickettsiales bacterium]|jgi:acetyl-CoA carboxylase carboxyl transferase subunit alpha|nr:acetyl-CoA carboxylase carboxyltransferase subunit alpha [Rickettsiales bacterium]